MAWLIAEEHGIDPQRDYWREYYALYRRWFYQGEKIDHRELTRLRQQAERQTAIVKHNYALLGVN